MTLILTQSEIRKLLPMDVCMELVSQAFVALTEETSQNPLRSALWLPDGTGLLGLMPGYVADPEVLGLKVVGVFPGNYGGALDSHQGFVALFDTKNGTALAILEASSITALRTAAASGVATRLLARGTASELALLGSGVQATSHLAAMLEARPIKRVRVFSPTHAKREAFAARESKRHGLEVSAVESAQAAVEGAQIVCCVSSSREPILRGDWLDAGTHINAAGACIAGARELDSQAVLNARLFVDRRESTMNEAGDFLIPKAEGVLDETHIQGEIGELLCKELPGRRSEEEITLFKSLGLAAQDLVCAKFVFQRARENSMGVDVDLRGIKEFDE